MAARVRFNILGEDNYYIEQSDDGIYSLPSEEFAECIAAQNAFNRLQDRLAKIDADNRHSSAELEARAKQAEALEAELRRLRSREHLISLQSPWSGPEV